MSEEVRKLNRGCHTDCLLELGIYDELIPEQKAEIAQLKAENKVLKEFAMEVIMFVSYGIDYPDASTIQGMAVKLGWISSVSATDDDCKKLREFKVSVSAGAQGYKFTSILKEASGGNKEEAISE